MGAAATARLLARLVTRLELAMPNTDIWDALGKTKRVPISTRIERMISIEPNSGCWLWAGFVRKNGYASLTVNGKTKFAHRASYEEFFGPIPDGLHIDHKCKVRCCVNPDHLEAVTVAENNRRSPRKKPLPDNCKWGHPFSGDNLYLAQGQRHCRTCRRIASLAKYHRMRKAR